VFVSTLNGSYEGLMKKITTRERVLFIGEEKPKVIFGKVKGKLDCRYRK